VLYELFFWGEWRCDGIFELVTENV